MTPSREALREARRNLGLTQAELGAKVNRSADTIRGWEAGRHPIDRNAWDKIELLIKRKERGKP